MRFGCGCVAGILGLAAAVFGVGWSVVKVLQEPILAPVSPPGSSDQAQAKLSEIVGRSPRGQTRHRATLTISEAEASAFLSRHLTAADLPLVDIRVGLRDGGEVEFVGRVRLRELLGESPFSHLRRPLPNFWLEHRVWLYLRARIRVEGSTGPRRRYVRLDVDRFAIGRLPIPAFLPRLLFDPTTLGLLRWPLPETVEDITIEKGRAVIRIAS